MNARRSVVGVDGSPCSLLALRWALQEAKSTHAKLEVVHAWSDPWGVVGPPSLWGAGRTGMAHLRADLADHVRRAVEDEDAAAVDITERIVAGDAAETLVGESESARLLVVGTTGLTGLRRWALGSVSQRCGQLSKVPVVLVPAASAPSIVNGDEEEDPTPVDGPAGPTAHPGKSGRDDGAGSVCSIG